MARTSSGSDAIVAATPRCVLKPSLVACVGIDDLSNDARIAVVVVFPHDPVIAIACPANSARWALAIEYSAALESSTAIVIKSRLTWAIAAGSAMIPAAPCSTAAAMKSRHLPATRQGDENVALFEHASVHADSIRRERFAGSAKQLASGRCGEPGCVVPHLPPGFLRIRAN